MSLFEIFPRINGPTNCVFLKTMESSSHTQCKGTVELKIKDDNTTCTINVVSLNFTVFVADVPRASDCPMISLLSGRMWELRSDLKSHPRICICFLLFFSFFNICWRETCQQFTQDRQSNFPDLFRQAEIAVKFCTPYAVLSNNVIRLASSHAGRVASVHTDAVCPFWTE